MHQNPMQGNTLPLVDAVFLEREASPLVSSIDHLLGILSDPELVVSQAMVLDLIALRWIAFDVLRGHTMDTTWFHSSHPKDVHCKLRCSTSRYLISRSIHRTLKTFTARAS